MKCKNIYINAAIVFAEVVKMLVLEIVWCS
jgi:hypothetical protein